jgi:hypothetical protein
MLLNVDLTMFWLLQKKYYMFSRSIGSITEKYIIYICGDDIDNFQFELLNHKKFQMGNLKFAFHNLQNQYGFLFKFLTINKKQR